MTGFFYFRLTANIFKFQFGIGKRATTFRNSKLYSQLWQRDVHVTFYYYFSIYILELLFLNKMQNTSRCYQRAARMWRGRADWRIRVSGLKGFEAVTAGKILKNILAISCIILHLLHNKSNSTARSVQVESNLQEQLSDHLHFRKLTCC